MLFNSSFFSHIQLLKDKYYTEYQFNLFSVLRSNSDEVRLHSRFLGEILNPQGTHGFNNLFLDEFLKHLKISPELSKDALVMTEYKNIDIFIKINDIAIIIENKIYAVDQDNQLSRYYESILAEGYKYIYIIYLTLDGANPSSQSIDKLKSSYLDSNQFVCLSYKTDVYSWIEKCLSHSVREPALRESFSQYLELIEKLTSKLRSEKYMEELKNSLTKDNNLVNFIDLQQAYNEVIIDLQVDLWKRIQKTSSELLGIEWKGSIANSEDKYSAIKNFSEGRKGSNYFGIYYELGDDSYHLGVEMQGDGIIFGIRCFKEEKLTKYNEIVNIFDTEPEFKGLRTCKWPFYRYVEPKIYYRNLTQADLVILSSQNKRQEIAKDISEKLSVIVNMVEVRKVF